jgi:hypothetical protein
MDYDFEWLVAAWKVAQQTNRTDLWNTVCDLITGYKYAVFSLGCYNEGLVIDLHMLWCIALTHRDNAK